MSLTYNEKGQFKGIATILFRTHKSAALAVQKYNGAPIDGGSSKLTLELIIDPTKKPLATRIVANQIKPVAKPAKTAATKKTVATGTKKPAPTKQAKAAAAADKKKKGLKANRAKKTVEQLDQEMADYFETKP